MKTKAIKEEISHMDRPQLLGKIDELQKELFALKLQASTASVKDFASKKRALRKLIACGLTQLRIQVLSREIVQ